MTVPTSTAHLTCLCGTTHEPGALLKSLVLPISGAEMCHCTDCRYTTGSLGASFADLNSAPSQKSLDACTPYVFSERNTGYFCTTCGTPNFVHVKSEGWWCCFAGIIERDLDQMSSKEEEWVKDIVKIGEHDFVAGTVDGGIAARMLKLGGDGSGRRDVSCFAKRSCYSDHRDKTEPELMRPEDVLAMQATVEKETAAAVAPAAKDDMMTAKCHCGGVDLRVKRANFNEDKQGLSERFTEAGDRYIAQFCACRSCRLQSAVSLQPWTYIPPQNFSVAATGKPVVFGREACKEGENANEGTTLKHYWSSTDVCRSFCGRCGASFFYWCDERPEVVDLSMGVVRGSSGVMAREWVSWRWRVSWGEECVDAEVMEAVLGKGEE